MASSFVSGRAICGQSERKERWRFFCSCRLIESSRRADLGGGGVSGSGEHEYEAMFSVRGMGETRCGEVPVLRVGGLGDFSRFAMSVGCP